MANEVYGYIGALVAIIGWGISNAPMKSRRVREAGADPVVFQLYYSATVFITSWLALAFVDFKFTPLGIAGAAFWVPGSVLAIYAVNALGLSIAQGTWSGMTMLVSFIWGAALFSEKPESVGMIVLAFILIVIGITGLSFATRRFYYKKEVSPATTDIPAAGPTVTPADVELSTGTPSSGSLDPSPESSDVDSDEGKKNTTEKELEKFDDIKINLDEETKKEVVVAAQQSSTKAKLIGLVCALFMGFFNGSILIPTQFVPDNIEGIPYIVSFGIGVGIVTPVYALLWFGLIRREVPKLHFKAVALPAFCAGVLWNIANVGGIMATKYLGLTVGYPLTQLALLVSGVYGMVIYKELPGVQTRVQYFLAACILLGGAVILALFG